MNKLKSALAGLEMLMVVGCSQGTEVPHSETDNLCQEISANIEKTAGTESTENYENNAESSENIPDYPSAQEIKEVDDKIAQLFDDWWNFKEKKENPKNAVVPILKGNFGATALKDKTCQSINIEAEKLARTLDLGLPRGWFNGREITLIQQLEEQIPLDGKYGLKAEEGFAIFAYLDRSKKIITLSADVREDSINPLYQTLIHEISHLHDPETNPILTILERKKLILALYERITAKNRFITEEVEYLNNDDEYQKRWLQVVEYWAEICARYLQDPSSLAQEDFDLVDSVVKKSDPNFNPWNGLFHLKYTLGGTSHMSDFSIDMQSSGWVTE